MLTLASFIAFSRIATNDFVNFDDDLFITQNHNVQSGFNAKSIKWAFTDTDLEYWHPLTWLSIMLDWHLFGPNASGHHLVSLLLHIGAVIFLFLFLNKTTNDVWPSAFAAAFFALHPLRVESVAWAAERKDVLSMFFGMASIYAYAFYAESMRLSRYLLCLILFTFSLMSKPMLITLPFILLLIDCWPLRRWQKAISESRYKLYGILICEKIPFIVLTIAASILTAWAANKIGTVSSLESSSLLLRILNTIVSYVSYLGKTFWPFDLAVLYTYSYYLPLWQTIIFCFLLIGLSIFAISALKKAPFLFVGWFWYMGTLIPVIGLVQVGSQALADRYTYLPSIGISIMLAWGIPLLLPREGTRIKILLPIGMVVLVILAGVTWQQCGFWKNSIYLWNHTLQITNNNYVAHYNFGKALFDKGEFEEAIGQYNKASRIAPNWPDNYIARGIVYYKLNKHQLAIEDCNRAIHLKPDSVLAYYNRGLAYVKIKNYQCAIYDFSKAINLAPAFARAYNNRGLSYQHLGQYQSAIDDFNKAIDLVPNFAKAIENRGNTYLSQGNLELGCSDAQKACTFGYCGTLEWGKSRGLCP